MTGVPRLVRVPVECEWYNPHVWKPLFAVALLIAMGVAIVAPTFYVLDPWLDVKMHLCGSVSDWNDFKSCLARHGIQDPERYLFVDATRQKQSDTQQTKRDGANGIVRREH